MSFNPDPNKPAEEVIFSHKKVRQNHPPLFLNNIEVKNVNEHKHLGLILDSKLTFGSHINEKLSKARKGVGVIKFLSSYVPVKTLDQIYKMYVRPHLDFCDVIYHKPEITNLFDSSIRLSYWMEQIERVQYQAALAVTGTWKGTSLNKIYDELGWEPLSKRRWFRRLVQFFKIQNNLTPQYLKTPVPTPRTHLYGTRTGNDIPNMKCNKNLYTSSFYPNAVKIWNDVGPELRLSVSLSAFKSEIIKIIRPVRRDVFNIHEPKAMSRLFQLRVGLSPLKHHKKLHKFNDTPTDICLCRMAAETTEHFLIQCDRYTDVRINLFQVINPILVSNGLHLPNDMLVKFLLYGDNTISIDDNKAVLAATLKFILKSTRFDLVNE